MAEQRKFQVTEFVTLNTDVTHRVGNVETLYAVAGSTVQVMVYDPSKEHPYAIRADKDGYRNVHVPEAFLDSQAGL